jgi:flavin prenyltransferase
VGVSGASGTVYGHRLLQRLGRNPQVETHLILSRAAERTAFLEMDLQAKDLKALATHVHAFEDIGSRLASGSFKTHGMVIAPCSIQTMSSIATGVTGNLLTRAADVMLKERRRLILLVREMPLHLGHLRTMTALAEMGATIAPPIPAFYRKPKTAMDLVDHAIDRVLDLLDLSDPEIVRWTGKAAISDSEDDHD